MNHETPTVTAEATVIAEIARESERYGQVINPGSIHMDDDPVFVNITRGDETVHAASYERYLDEPRRARGHSAVADVESFTRLLTMPMHEGTVIFADENQNTLTAVVNYQTWRDHTVTLELRHSEQFKQWSRSSGKLYGQQDFAELIEDNLADIMEPAAADMLELAQSFHATKEVSFESSKRLSSGAVRFRYLESVNAKAGMAGDLEVPTRFVIAIPLWRGGDRIPMTANLRYRIGQGGLLLGYKLVGLDDIERTAFAALVEDVENRLTPENYEGLPHTVVRGPAPQPVAPLP